MPNQVMPKFRERQLRGAAPANLVTGAVKLLLVDTNDYVFAATHEFLSDVAATARVAISAALTGKTFANGVFDSNDLVPAFAAATGDPSEALYLFLDTGDPATSNLIAFYDTGVTGLPVTPNGGDINSTANVSGWFAL